MAPRQRRAGAPTGKIDIVSPHLRLEWRTIETALAQDLAGRYTTPPRLGTTDELAEILSIEARLRAAGHHVLTRNLTDVYGPRTVGGVVAALLGKGIDAYVLIDNDATQPARTAVCRAAEEALNLFRTANPHQLHDNGWERGHEGRWQLLLQQR